jgi:rhodanese-related sulfurtransferase
MRKKSNPNSIRSELLRAAMVLGFSAALGGVVNMFSRDPLPIFTEEKTIPSTTVASPAAVDPGKISLDDVLRSTKDANQDVRILDVRGEAEFDTGHIPRSIHVQHDNLLKSQAAIDAALQGATLIVVLCDSDLCSKADTVAESLTKLGFKNVRVLQGGWESYKRSGYIVEETRR